MRDNKKWDIRYLKIAKSVSEWSKDPSTKVGSVIVRPDNTIASIGFNGFPKKIKDDPEKLDDRPTKTKYVIHAEMNAIKNCKEDITGYTVYTYPFLPCDRCATHLINYNISRVVTIQTPEDKIEKWEPIFQTTKEMFEESGVDWTQYTEEDLNE